MQRKRPLESLLTPTSASNDGIEVNGNYISPYNAESPSPSSKRFARDVNDHPVPLVLNAGESEMHSVYQELQSELAFLKRHSEVAQRIPHAVRLLEKECFKFKNCIEPEYLEVDINKQTKKEILILKAEKDDEIEFPSNAAAITTPRPVRQCRVRRNAGASSQSMDSVVSSDSDSSYPVNKSVASSSKKNRGATPRAAELLRQKAEKKEEQRKAKEEKQRAVDEKKRIKEEKQRVADEKKRVKEEEKKKAERMRLAQQIDKFCVKQVKPQRKVMPAPSDHWLFSAFEIKVNMNIAPSHRRPPLSLEQKRNLMKIQIIKSDYLQKVPQRPVTKVRPLKAKLFQFHNSHRPSWYGTATKRSKAVSGRRPFAKHTTLDYDYESDDEWDDEEEGDECKSEEEDYGVVSDDEDDEKSFAEEYKLDEFFVEHGYLSSDEGDPEEKLPNEYEEDRTRRLKERAEEWKIEQKARQRRHQTKKLVANEYGPCFSPPGDDVPDFVKKNLHVGILFEYLD